MKPIGQPMIIDPQTVVQFMHGRDGRTIPMRIAVCREHSTCTLLFFDGDDCGPHFRWATPADLPVTPQGGVAA